MLPSASANRRHLLLPLALLAVSCVAVLLLSAADAALPDGRLHVSFLSVGQGDATLIRTPGGRNILIDAGPGEAVESLLPAELPFFDRRLDLAVLTHPHRDHLDGFLGLLTRYRIDALLLTGVRADSPQYERFVQLSQGKLRLIAVHDRDYELEPGLTLDVLWPQRALDGVPVDSSKLNPTSTVLRLRYGKTALLLAGDIDAATERALLASGVDVDSTVLKVAHHGSRYSTADAFLSHVTPWVAVIMSGAGNSYGHPHSQTLSRLSAAGVQVYRTDTFGTVRAECDNAGECAFSHDRRPPATPTAP